MLRGLSDQELDDLAELLGKVPCRASLKLLKAICKHVPERCHAAIVALGHGHMLGAVPFLRSLAETFTDCRLYWVLNALEWVESWHGKYTIETQALMARIALDDLQSDENRLEACHYFAGELTYTHRISHPEVLELVRTRAAEGTIEWMEELEYMEEKASGRRGRRRA